jgi:DNA-binding NarL/FixJ family response regulator
VKTRVSIPAVNPRRRILILDDHPITRYGLVQLLNEQPDLTVCGEAETAQAALSLISSNKPDLVLADITLPGKSGLEFIKDAQARHPDLPILVMSMHDEGIYAERVLRAGGRGYIMKSEGGAKLLEAVRAVLEGQLYVSKSISLSLLNALAHRASATPEPRPGILTDREFEVFQLLGQGFSTRDIAARLCVSPKTVGTHRLHIKEKLQLRTGAEVLREAVRWAATQQLV